MTSSAMTRATRYILIIVQHLTCHDIYNIYTLCTKFSTQGRPHGRRVPELRVPEADHREDAAILERGHRAPAQGRKNQNIHAYSMWNIP